MNFVTGLEGVEVFGFVEIPEHGRAVFAAGGAEGAVGRDGYGVDVARVADVVGLDAAGGQFPDLRRILLARVTLGFEDGRGIKWNAISALVNVCLMAARALK